MTEMPPGWTPKWTPIAMEETPCLLCGSVQAEHFVDGADLQMQLPGHFAYVRCAQCGLIYQNPRPTPEAISRYYPQDYLPFAQHQGGSPLRRWLVRYGIQKRCRPLLRAYTGKRPGSLLDIGCGPGYFLAAMQEHGWRVTGVEGNPAAADFGRRQLGVAIEAGRLEDINFAEHSFDAVTLWDVLEHLHRPGPGLERIWRLLRPDGLLLVRTPVVDSLDARLFGSAWAGLDPPRHLTIFSRQTLEAMVAQHGFQPMRAWTLSGSHASFALSVRFHVRAQGSPAPLDRLAQWAASPVGALLGAPYFFLIDRLQLSPEWTLLARKVRRDAHD